MNRMEMLQRIDDFAAGAGSTVLRKHAIQMKKLIREECIFDFQLKEWVDALEQEKRAEDAPPALPK